VFLSIIIQKGTEIRFMDNTNKGITWKVYAIAGVLTLLSAVWVQLTELIFQTCQISESVPAIPALAFLLLLTGINFLVNRFAKKYALTRSEIVFIYIFLAVAVPMMSVGVVRRLFPLLTALFYFNTPENKFEVLQKYIPDWLVPKDNETIRAMYEGAVNNVVPWLNWAVPLLMWTLFLVILWFTLMCILVLFRKQWVEKEHLTFPLLYLPLEITEDSKLGDKVPFFKNPVMWIGFGLAFMYNAANILNAFNPDFPAMGTSLDIGKYFTEAPFSSIRPLNLFYRPELIGLGYLVSLEVSFSIWLFYLLFKISTVFANVAGYKIPGFPFEQEQSFGVYLALGLFLTWTARKHILTAVRKAFFNDPGIDDTDEPLPYKVAVFGILGGTLFLIAYLTLAGMSLWVSILLLFLMYITALVYTRIRAEVGTPMMLLYPFNAGGQTFMYNAFGTGIFSVGGNFANLTLLSVMRFIGGEDAYFHALAANQMEAFKLADEVKTNKRRVAVLLIIAVAVGLIVSYCLHLISYYKYGCNLLEGGTSTGGYRVTLALKEYNTASAAMLNPVQPNLTKTAYTVFGFAVTTVMIQLRTFIVGLPLNPLGYAMAGAYGRILWGPFFLVWLLKLLILRIGGVNLYRKLIPLFIGLAVGHFITAGAIWGTAAIFGGADAYRNYGVFFG